MDEPILVVISLTMFIGSYLAGCIPLFFSLNERRIRIASIFGAGLLIGTAFCVIIPEGISSLAMISLDKTNQHEFGQPMGKMEHTIPKLKKEWKTNEKVQRRNVEHWDENGQRKETIGGRRKKRSTNEMRTQGTGLMRKGNLGEGVQSNGRGKGEQQRHEGGERARESNFELLNGVIGISLLVGFLFMHVIDQLSKLSHSSRLKGIPTLGLVIHAFADGIAMGSASSAGSQLDLQILIFIAIMLHKAPTAFALISILLASGLDKARVRRHLLIFSLAAPIGTILTYIFLYMVQSPMPDNNLADVREQSPSQFTGIVLLFSAGTFLYIATVHVLPELMEAKCAGAFAGAGISGSREMLLGCGEKTPSLAPSRFSLVELCLFCISAIIPSFISSATHSEHRH